MFRISFRSIFAKVSCSKKDGSKIRVATKRPIVEDELRSSSQYCHSRVPKWLVSFHSPYRYFHRKGHSTLRQWRRKSRSSFRGNTLLQSRQTLFMDSRCRRWPMSIRKLYSGCFHVAKYRHTCLERTHQPRYQPAFFNETVTRVTASIRDIVYRW